jgi:hypothetical protein
VSKSSRINVNFADSQKIVFSVANRRDACTMVPFSRPKGNSNYPGRAKILISGQADTDPRTESQGDDAQSAPLALLTSGHFCRSKSL